MRKLRGSLHVMDIREFSIDGRGMRGRRAFRNISGIHSSHFIPVAALERGGGRFNDDNGTAKSHTP